VALCAKHVALCAEHLWRFAHNMCCAKRVWRFAQNICGALRRTCVAQSMCGVLRRTSAALFAEHVWRFAHNMCAALRGTCAMHIQACLCWFVYRTCICIHLMSYARIWFKQHRRFLLAWHQLVWVGPSNACERVRGCYRPVVHRCAHDTRPDHDVGLWILVCLQGPSHACRCVPGILQTHAQLHPLHHTRHSIPTQVISSCRQRPSD